MIRYSRGTGIHDNKPAQRHAEDFARFVESLERDRAPTKERAHYICAPLNGDATRRREGVLPRTWIALDFDHLPADVLPDLRTWLARFEGCAWPTHSSKPDAPRERALIAMDRPASREECLRVGAALVRDIKDEFGIEVDPATLRGEQPVFGPPVGVQIAKFFGDPLPVDKYLASAPTVEEVKTAPVELRNGEAIRAGGRDAALTSLAGRMRRFGSSESEIEAYLTAVNERRCVPPLSAADVAKIARSTARYAPEIDGFEVGGGSGEASLVTGADFLASIVTPDYAVYPIVQRSHVVAITAHTGHGKSTLAYAMACWIARGLTVGPFECKQGRVLLLIGENPPNAALQLRAAVARYGVSDEDLRSRLVVRSGSAFMADIGVSITRELKDGGEFVAVIVDTSSAFFSYEDEIDNVQARRHAVDMRTLTELPGAPAVLVMCHPTKSATQDALLPRGGGAFLNEIDANLTLWNDGEKCLLSYTKLRGTPFSPIGVRFEPQEVGAVDHKGRPMVPMVAVVLDDLQEAAIAHARTFDEDALLRAMLANPRASIATLADKCGWGRNKAKAQRLLDALKVEKPALVRFFRGAYELTENGKKEAEKCG